MSKRTDDDFLRDINEAVCRIRTYTDGMTYDHFLADTKTQDAVVRNLEVIGEATKSLSTELREKYPDVPCWFRLCPGTACPALANDVHDLSRVDPQVDRLDVERRPGSGFDPHGEDLPVLALDSDFAIFGRLFEEGGEILSRFGIGVYDHLFTSMTLAFICSAHSIR